MTQLVIRHDAIRRGGRVVLEPGEITAPAPAAIAIVGINGSGKSSLFMHLTNTLKNPHNPISILKTQSPKLNSQYSILNSQNSILNTQFSILNSHRPESVTLCNTPVSNFAYAPQTPALPPWLHVEDVATCYGTSFDHLTHTMPGLHLDELRARRAGDLSLGQQQALAIALALAQPARVLILDEPFAALDFRRRLGALALLHSWKRGKPDRALLLSSQNAADLVDVCDHFVVIRDGRYVFSGMRNQLLDDDGTDPALQRIESRLLALLT